MKILRFTVPGGAALWQDGGGSVVESYGMGTCSWEDADGFKMEGVVLEREEVEDGGLAMIVAMADDHAERFAIHCAVNTGATVHWHDDPIGP